ncbi:hypothetical protein [Mycobacterium sp. DL440]|uniref:hypothetical protein n=1 Tax=Mycobacterium sp. DL440 TaxID=2675523 RepID=UPI001FB9E38B|nr:hypothetical protein [Mycobacterium sp. DL440]
MHSLTESGSGYFGTELKLVTFVLIGLCLTVTACGGRIEHNGRNVKDVVPQSQQQAQDTVFGYLKRTLDGLPSGTVLDGTRYGSAGSTSYCDDNDSSPTAPRNFSTTGELHSPPGIDNGTTVRNVGEVWRSWGWNVTERDEFRKPNQFGYGPDGYRLQIVSASPTSFPPTVGATSPCYPGTIARNDIGFPMQITSGS